MEALSSLPAVTRSALLHVQLLLRKTRVRQQDKAFFGNIRTEVAFLLVILLVGSESQVLLQRALM